MVNCLKQQQQQQQHNNKVLAIIVAKFATQQLFVFHFPEILLVTLN